MGGAVDRIDVDLIAHPDQDQAAAKKELTVHLATFNAFRAGSSRKPALATVALAAAKRASAEEVVTTKEEQV